jgi:hypothetical protein
MATQDFGAQISAPGTITMPSNSAYDFGTGDFTAMALVQTTAPGTLISRKSSQSGSGNGGWLLVVKPGGVIQFITTDGVTSYEVDSGAVTVFDGEWHHIAAVRAQGTLSIFFDGDPLPVTASSPNNTSLDVDNDARLVVGGTDQQQEPYNQFVGIIEDVAIWERALNQAEIIPAMANNIPADAPDLVGYWNMNNDVNDSSDTGNNGTINGNVSFVPIFHGIWIESENDYSYCAIDNVYDEQLLAESAGITPSLNISRKQTVIVGQGTPFLYATLMGPIDATTFPAGVALTIQGPDGTIYNQESATDTLYVKMSGTSLWQLVVKNPQPGNWLITIDAAQGYGFNFDFQTLPSANPTQTMLNVLSNIYSQDQLANRFRSLASLNLSSSNFDWALAVAAVASMTAITIIAAPIVLTGAAVSVPLLVAGLAAVTVSQAALYIKVSSDIGVAAAAQKLVGFAKFSPYPQLTVYVWSYRGSTEAWGHASLQLIDGTYISWWPSQPRQPLLPVPFNQMPLLGNIYSAPAIPNRTFVADALAEGSDYTPPISLAPDYAIGITVLNNAPIKNWWAAFSTDPNSLWKTLNQNCSTTVADALFAGDVNRILTHNEYTKFRAITIWTPADVVDFANTIAAYNPT